ncbi:FecR family protein [Saccharicrinis sp. GN24d3]|uniref:FecR family protein n=1 Tax=Saccharicrinis sp. GN24d3 TaxID=3458416 RepID=UPI00403536A4
MNESYILLLKHFLRETTSEEEMLVDEYKEVHKAEYEVLKKIWSTGGGQIDVRQFDTQKALARVEQAVTQRNKPQPKLISLLTRFKRVAAAIVVCILSVTAYLMVAHFTSTKTLVVDCTMSGPENSVVLSDGTTIWLNKGAKLTYRQTFGSKERVVSLSGEAFFEVAKDSLRPFTVKMQTVDVRVLGTSFNIKDMGNKTSVTVATGKVSVKANQLDKSVVLISGQTAEVNHNSLDYFDTRNKNYLAWKTGVFVFENTPLPQVIRDLNTYYDTKIESIPSGGNSCLLTANFNQKPLAEIIEVLSLTCDVNFKKVNNTYWISVQ